MPAKKRLLVPPLSPVKASPPSSLHAFATGKENVMSLNTLTSNTAREIISSAGILDNLTPTTKSSGVAKEKDKHRKRALMDLTGFSRNAENMGKENVKPKDPVKQRVRDWERERERLREMAALEDRDKDNGDEPETARKQKKIHKDKTDKENDQKENQGLHVAAHSAPRVPAHTTPLSPLGKYLNPQ
jgi:serine/threonine-protein kinase GIN4